MATERFFDSIEAANLSVDVDGERIGVRPVLSGDYAIYESNSAKRFAITTGGLLKRAFVVDISTLSEYVRTPITSGETEFSIVDISPVLDAIFER